MSNNITDLVTHYYLSWGVSSPTDISLYLWDNAVNVSVVYRPGRTTSIPFRRATRVFCDGHKPILLRRVEIAHEIGHALLHTGEQEGMEHIYRGKQEHDADTFSMEALMPEYLVRKSLQEAPYGRGQAEQYIAELYGVPLPFAARRLDVLLRKTREIYAQSAPYCDYVVRDPVDRKWKYQMSLTGEVIGAIKQNRRGY